MQESRAIMLEDERNLIVFLHDTKRYSFKEISKLPQFQVSPQAIHKRYKKAKGLTQG